MLLRRRRKRSGLSLLEVLTALAIFFLSVVAISQMVDTASQTAVRAQRMTRASIICDTIMAELANGIMPLESVGEAPAEGEDPGWYYTVIVEPEDWTSVSVDSQSVTGLSTVHVTVGFRGMRPAADVEYALSRIILDPRLRKNATEPTIAGTAPSSSGSSGAGASGAGGQGGQNNNASTPGSNQSGSGSGGGRANSGGGRTNSGGGSGAGGGGGRGGNTGGRGGPGGNTGGGPGGGPGGPGGGPGNTGSSGRGGGPGRG